MDELIQNILAAVGAVVAAGNAIVRLTPTKADDTWWAKYVSGPAATILELFAPKRK